MSERTRPSSSITRRDAVKGAVALAALGVSSALEGRDADSAAASAVVRGSRVKRQRVAIVGAGAGGVAAAYLLGGVHDVDLFEARSKIGGHCDSHVIGYRGRRLTVDLGAQFFHPDTHPLYVTLLEQLGLYDPAHPGRDKTIEAPASLCIFPTAGGPPVFASSNALATPHRALNFVTYIELARQAVLSDLPWTTTVDAWIRGLAVTQSFKNDIVYPWITALIGCSRADALKASARSILQTFALSFPADVSQGALTFNSTIGLQGNLQRMLSRSRATHLHRATAVHALKRGRAGWFLETPAGTCGPYGSVVLNAPPHVGRTLMRAVPGFGHLATVLSAYEYFDSRILIHTDPAYVQHNRRNWEVYNAGVRGPECEGSVWYGALDQKRPSGQTIELFKSWAERRRTDPRHIVLERRFKHPHISRSTIQAARELGPLQGRDGLYFSGVYTTGFDSQESAVYSAMQVAKSLAPRSQTLASLKTRLATRGLAGISYEL
jgi:predicted NAD/FAD-binding protein